MSDAYYSNGGGNATPSYQGDRAAVVREIRKLWKQLNSAGPGAAIPLEKAWSYSGVVAPFEDRVGQPWIAPGNLSIANMQVTLAETSSVSYTVDVRVSNELVASINVPAGFSSVLSAVGANVLKGQTVKVTLRAAAGGDGENMGMVLRYEPNPQ